MQGDCKSGAQADELRRVRVEGTGDELLVRGQEGKDPKDSICEFRRKQFSSDGRYLFSLSPAWATSGALHVYDTRDKKLSFVMPANDVIVLSACKSADYRDNLVVQQHRYFVVAEATTGTGSTIAPARRRRGRSANMTASRPCARRSMRQACASGER